MTSADRHHVVEELLPAYALGAADEAEVRQVEEHLEECAECRAELAAWRRATEALAASVPTVEPSATAREKLLAEIGADARSVARPGGAGLPRRSPLRLAAGFVLAAVAIAALAWGLLGQRRLRSEVDSLEGQVARLEGRLADADAELVRSRAQLQSAREVLAVVTRSAPSQDVLLAGLETAPQGHGRLIVDRANRRAVLLAGQLPPLTAGRVYQLWTLKDGAPASAGVFETVADGTAIHMVENIPTETPDNWAVTIEPEGGVPQPTGPMVLLG